MINIEIINHSSNELPKYETEFSAGMDLRADLKSIKNSNNLYNANFDAEFKTLVIFPGGRALIPVGISTAIPVGYEAQIRPRSGLALKHGITVLNSPGTIDSDYRNLWGVILMNTSNTSYQVLDGDRIAQVVFNKFENAIWNEVESLSETDRGLGGFGHTGK